MPMPSRQATNMVLYLLPRNVNKRLVFYILQIQIQGDQAHDGLRGLQIPGKAGYFTPLQPVPIQLQGTQAILCRREAEQNRQKRGYHSARAQVANATKSRQMELAKVG